MICVTAVYIFNPLKFKEWLEYTEKLSRFEYSFYRHKNRQSYYLSEKIFLYEFILSCKRLTWDLWVVVRNWDTLVNIVPATEFREVLKEFDYLVPTFVCWSESNEGLDWFMLLWIKHTSWLSMSPFWWLVRRLGFLISMFALHYFLFIYKFIIL